MQFCCPKSSFHSWQIPSPLPLPLTFPSRLHRHLPIPCTSDGGGGPRNEEGDDKFQRSVILVEKNGNGVSRRYILSEDDSEVKSYLEEHVPHTSNSSGPPISEGELPWLPSVIKDLFLPSGFPESVSNDYLEYMLWQHVNLTLAVNFTWAVGVGSFSGTTAAASAAAIRWVTKDGIGAVGRLFIGGRFGNLFDDDPKQWRMYADFIGSAGSIFDLTTPLYPSYFLPLASMGNLAKAVARGLKDPSFRVIQNHFAISGNLGEVAAKEEVWEVAAELLGLAIGILILDAPGLSSSYSVLTFTWLSVRLLHLWFRYLSLSVLQFDTINLKRACILVNSHVRLSTVLGCHECNRMENILQWQRFSKPRIHFGVSLQELLDGEKGSSVVKVIRLYSKERYFLVVNRMQFGELEVFVSFKEGATSLSVLRSLWQAYWVYQNWSWSNNVEEQIEESLISLEKRFDDFMQQLKNAGWDTSQLNLKVPRDFSIQELPSL
ncbi:OLC1v1033698C1 [Oldenlandia corymbosa var. corymbosa]|uniref:OLC1v1033698C1 n=1 Tax=Oldenlandia corymbosa var. corymbosa TaxID=529605 RepID=A0AAV1CRQ8_OLDCO|nr:OLC1v1033698C1 [Oldenlandia corymbosa var. corymbosa]